MTKEQKARAYDEALERARKRVLIEPQDHTDTILKDIFPELRKSEDERIMSAMIRGFNSLMANQPVATFAGESIRDILAYLEKQKDASKAIEAVDRIDKYIDEHLANAHDMKDSNPDKKYYRGWDDALGEMAGILQDVYSEGKQKEQKPVENINESANDFAKEYSFNIESKLYPQLIGKQKELWRSEIEEAIINGFKKGAKLSKDRKNREIEDGYRSLCKF